MRYNGDILSLTKWQNRYRLATCHWITRSRPILFLCSDNFHTVQKGVRST